MLINRRKRLAYIFGKWTERVKACEISMYEETVERIKRENKSPQNSPGHKKILTRLSSLKVSSFKPSHQDSLDDPSQDPDMDGITIDDVPGSILLWQVTPRPPNSSEVSIYFKFLA